MLGVLLDDGDGLGAFEGVEFGDAAGVAAFAEGGGEKDLDDFADLAVGEQIAGKAEDVAVVGLAGDASGGHAAKTCRSTALREAPIDPRAEEFAGPRAPILQSPGGISRSSRVFHTFRARFAAHR